jgi:hypothetical protein
MMALGRGTTIVFAFNSTSFLIKKVYVYFSYSEGVREPHSLSDERERGRKRKREGEGERERVMPEEKKCNNIHLR